MSTDRVEVIGKMAKGICDWFEDTQDSHLDESFMPCQFHQDEAEAAYKAIEGEDLPWFIENPVNDALGETMLYHKRG